MQILIHHISRSKTGGIKSLNPSSKKLTFLRNTWLRETPDKFLLPLFKGNLIKGTRLIVVYNGNNVKALDNPQDTL